MKKLLLFFLTLFSAFVAKAEVSQITIAQFLEQKDTVTVYQLSGVVTQIKNTTYGNFYIDDSTASIYIYGLLNEAGETKKFSSMGINVGDSIILQGVYAEYQGSPEIINAQYISHHSNGEVEPDPELTPDTPVNGNYFVNGDFESWTDGVADNWKSTTTASNATLVQSSDAHSGSSSVSVASASSNKRLAYKELVLAAGTYTFAFYAKGAADNENPEARPGYAPINADGSMGSYAYGDYIKLSGDWSLLTYTFTLDKATKLNMVVMNPKNTGTILIDDASLVEGSTPLAIKSVKAVNFENAVIYNICGKRVTDMSQRGIYIVNGKKVVVK